MFTNQALALRTTSAPSRVLRHKVAQRLKRGRWGLMHKFTLRKWEQHFNGVVAHIFNEVGWPTLPVTFDPLHRYLDGYEIVYLGIEDFPSDELPHECATNEIPEGRHIVGRNAILLFADNNVTNTRHRFTLAHEWGHVMQKFDGEFKAEMEAIADPEARQDIIEIVANSFAASYLMPSRLLKSATDSLPMFPIDIDLSAEIIAHRFGVSQQAMFYRLKNSLYQR